ncbi:MAG TPA: hypothetical protein VMS29_04730, partial [Pyrinomonadaceae bacterium]|nr:hypothetical protein [Pyrinomonadaceae bacterium]
AILAQSEDDAVNARKARLNAILEESLGDVQNLKLPENRAFFYARIGNIIWPQDQKRARSLFLYAATELVNAQNFAESKRSLNPYNELLTGGNTRQQILNTIASRDAELALELLTRTCPAALQRALDNDPDKNKKISNYHQNNAHLAQNENYMEQNFYRMAAEQSPERAVKILKESLSKGLSNETFNQLNRLAEKDPAAGAEMASQVVEKLLRSGYVASEQPLYANIQLTQSILNHQMSRQNGDDIKLKFDNTQIRDLAAKFVSAYLTDKQVAPYLGSSILPIAEKLLPSSVEQIKKAASRMNPQNGNSDYDAAYQKLMENDTPVEQMLAAANKFPINNRRQIYQTASNKLMGQGDWQSAREVLSENFEDDDYMITNFDSQLVYNLTNQGKFAEAERVIDGLPVENRIGHLVNLSTAMLARDPKENRVQALALLEKARQLTSEKPENTNEMNMLMQVIGGYGQLNPAEAIRLYEGVVPKIVELTDASAVLNGFQVNSNVRDGEFLIVHGDPFNNFGGNLSMIGAFSRFDFDRTMKLVDSFNRPEMRISLRLQLLDGSEIITSSVTTRSSISIRNQRKGK